MFKKQNIKSYALIAGLATVLFLPITADADRAADRATKEDGRGLESTRGNNSVAEILKHQDGHPDGASTNRVHLDPTEARDARIQICVTENMGASPSGRVGATAYCENLE
jgi:hypothetical protein